MSCTIRLNGATRSIPPRTTVGTLLERLELPIDGVAVAIDRQVVPRSEHASRILRDGEEVEVIRAVGGG